VRPQPTQSVDTWSTVQTLMQGLSMAAMTRFGLRLAELKDRGGERNR
jgi:hypothetical protein